MNELQILGNENIMTSLEIAELTRKEHNKILRDIRDEIEKLEKQGILQPNNIPYQRYVDCGYFRVIESKWNDYVTGDVKISFKTVVYQKGIEYIAKILRELGYQKIEVA